MLKLCGIRAGFPLFARILQIPKKALAKCEKLCYTK